MNVTLTGGNYAKVRIKRLHPQADVPTYAHDGDSGFDLVAVEDVIVQPGQTAKVPTGLAFEIPSGYEMQIRPRSGITLTTKLRVQLGTVDSGYTGEVGLIVDNNPIVDSVYDDYVITLSNGPIKYHKRVPIGTYIIRRGDKIAQAVIAPVVRAEFEEVDSLTDTARGHAGFGSTGTA